MVSKKPWVGLVSKKGWVVYGLFRARQYISIYFIKKEPIKKEKPYVVLFISIVVISPRDITICT